MKLKLNLMNSAACVCLAAFSAQADDAMPQTFREATNQIHDMRGMMRAYQLHGAVKTGDLIGSKAVNGDGQNLGKVNDLLLDLQAGRVVQVIVSSGGVLGMGGSLMAVPPGIVHADATNRVVRIDADKNRFEAGPKFVATEYIEQSNQSNAVVEAYTYYNERPFFANARFGTNVFEETSSGIVALNMDGSPANGGGRLMDIVYSQNNLKPTDDNMQDTNAMAGYGQMGTNAADGGGRLMDAANNQRIPGDYSQDTNATANYGALGYTNSTGNAADNGGKLMDIANNQKYPNDNLQDSNTVSGYGMNGGTNAADAWAGGRHMHRAELGYLQRASKLKGLTVKNLQGDSVGTIKDFAVDLGAGRIVAVIISTGGFLDMGNELSAVPPSVLRYNGDHDGVEFDTTKDSLANAPHFKADQWPDVGQPDYEYGVYRAYRVNPYFSTNSYRNSYRNNGMVDADNAGRNVRDRDGRHLTPMDQGNNAEDIRITAQIRKEVVANKGLSVNAKNVKIITLNGQVTLRGPVNTVDEKNTIGDIATRIAQAGNVDNQLEVRATASN
ncbi:MAG TPA: PRC-barrel domain-containing protein [Verrucomicrobiae bacterium]|nr:PRC-barrel domain-containing protein [Verrucomicrobiae bacterium]